MRIHAEGMDLALCLCDSGQCFEWQRRRDRYAAAPGGRPLVLWMERDELCAEGWPEGDVRRYLGMDRRIPSDAGLPETAMRAVRLFPGLGVLRQPAWDAVVMSILTANNNVRRIELLTHRLADAFGERFETSVGEIAALPTAGRLAQCREAELRELGVGYRAPYLIGTARLVSEGFPLKAVSRMPLEEARRML